MPLDPAAIGRPGEPYLASWTSTDALLYALGVGAGVDEPAFTTENSEGVEQQVLPTFAVVIGSGIDRMPDFGTYDLAKLVHAEQRITLHRPIPVEGAVEMSRRVVAMYDKGKAAIVAIEAEAIDQTDGQPLFTTYSSSYIAGEGGWGGPRGTTKRRNETPDRPPDHEVRHTTSPDQALIYRLSGDRNRLHSDPVFAARGGFAQPILHGLCTYGFTGRALLHTLAESDSARIEHIEGRFTATMVPGDTLTVQIWRTDEREAVFQTLRGDGTVVVGGGGVRLR